jgi:hypothetical protein
MNPILDRLLQPDILAVCIPIVAIVGGFTVAITKMVIHHRERMALIDRGVHPDSLQDQPGASE